jgi:hypothetical protein
MKYRVRVTRLREQECELWLDAANEELAIDKAMEMIDDVAATIWQDSDTEPHTYGVDDIRPGDKSDRPCARAYSSVNSPG